MSTLHHESLLETCYDEAWEDYRKKNNLTYEQLTTIEQNHQFGILPEIEADATKRFNDLLQ